MIMTKLKQQTQPYHDRLEENVYAKAILDEDVTLDAYRTFLSKFFGFYRPLEADLDRLFAQTDLDFDFAARRKTALLSRDLGQLGLALENLPLCDRTPQPESVPQALGCLYVMEGATLGGQIILRHVAPRLQITPARGGAFFNSYGAKVGLMWRSFRQFATEQIATSRQEREIIDAAQQTFVAFEHWLIPTKER